MSRGLRISRKLRDHSFVRFLLVGVLNTLVGLSTMFILLNGLGMNYWASTFIGNSVGAVLSFVLNRSFTFRSNVHWLSGFVKFTIVILVCYMIAYGGSVVMVERLLAWFFGNDNVKLIENVSILVGNGLYTILNYTGHRWFTFRERRRSAEA